MTVSPIVPEEVEAVFRHFLTCELSTCSKDGAPVTWPIEPYYQAEKGRFLLTTSSWLFYPQKYIPGAGIGGLMGLVKFVQDGRRNTKRYLEKRYLARPAIAWDTIHAIWADIHRSRHVNKA